MPLTGLDGPFELTPNAIDKVITKKSAGNYALGRMSEQTFIISYVGRSDEDLASHLKDWVGSYREFKWKYASSPKAAFLKECSNYHDFGVGGDNKAHPVRPENSDWQCPRCRKEGVLSRST